MDSYEHENAQLREELAALRAESERSRAETQNLKAMVTTLLAAQSHPFSTQGATLATIPVPIVSTNASQFTKPEGSTWGIPTSFGEETRPLISEISTAIPQMIPDPQPENVGSNNQMDGLQKRLDEVQRELRALHRKDSLNKETRELCLVPDAVIPCQSESGLRSPFKLNSHLQSLVQTHRMDQLEQEVRELREEVTDLRAEVERLTSLASSPTVKKDQPRAQSMPQTQHQPLCVQVPQQHRPAHHLVTAATPVINVVQNPGRPPQFPQHRHQYLQQPRQQALQQVAQQNQAQKGPTFDSIPMKYAELLPALLERNLVQLRAPPRIPEPLPAWWRADRFCAFHSGAPGHDTEYCMGLKTAVQNLVRANLLTFKDTNPKRAV